jgi:hypothetical protein
MDVPINYLAVLLCGVASMVLGFVWFGPLFGKMWMELSGMPAGAMERAKNDPAMKRQMYQSYAIQLVASLVMASILACFLVFAGIYLAETGTLMLGLKVGFFMWLGFVAPPTLGMVLWEGKPWKLWALINAYWLVLLLVFGAILALWPAMA